MSEAMSECNTCGAKMTGKYHIDCEHSCVGHLQRQLAEARGEKANLIKWLDQEKQDWGSSKKDTWNPYCRVLSKLKGKGE